MLNLLDPGTEVHIQRLSWGRPHTPEQNEQGTWIPEPKNATNASHWDFHDAGPERTE